MSVVAGAPGIAGVGEDTLDGPGGVTVSVVVGG